MRKTEGGWTLIEILVVVTIIATLAGLVSLAAIHARGKGDEVACIQHVGDLVRMLESDARYPERDGTSFLLSLVAAGHIAGRDGLENLFCPGDMEESLDRAGGEKAYEGLDLKTPGDTGHLTSYAGRAQRDRACAAIRGPLQVVLLCDDSEDHHNRRGLAWGSRAGPRSSATRSTTTGSRGRRRWTWAPRAPWTS